MTNVRTHHRPLDHKRLVLRRRSEVARAVRLFTELKGYNEVTTLHEADDSCCKAEPWAKTLAFILGRSGRKTLLVTP